MRKIKYKLIIAGIVSEPCLNVAKMGLQRSFDPQFCLCLFCVFSDYEVPIGTEFDAIINSQTKEKYPVKAKLIDVTQQWAKPFDCIPRGYKTISRFSFTSVTDVNWLKNEIPTVNNWYGNDKKFKLISYKNQSTTKSAATA